MSIQQLMIRLPHLREKFEKIEKEQKTIERPPELTSSLLCETFAWTETEDGWDFWAEVLLRVLNKEAEL